MDKLTRPDLSGVSVEVRAYIESLEQALKLKKTVQPRSLKKTNLHTNDADEALDSPLPVHEESEPVTSKNLITFTRYGLAKRTPRHLYNLQSRGGMGVFDIDCPENDPPSAIISAEPEETLLLVTNFGRAFRLPVISIPEAPVRARGQSIVGKFGLEEDEIISAVVPILAEGYLALLGESGMVRLLRHHVFGEYMKFGANLLDLRTFGSLVSACWTSGDADLFIATSQGKAIRFSEKQVSPQGSLGIRLSPSDRAVAIASVEDDSGVFLLSADGKGTIRQMQGFAPNKTPGTGGKIAIATDRLVTAAAVSQKDQIMIISRLSKIIRFRVEMVPPKDGVVQGVVCMSLRADEPAALVITA